MQLTKAVNELHSMGIVHRDLKPENVLLTSSGEIKLIDYGAACDLSTGLNFNPEQGMLDPRFSPPEELVLPETFPKAPRAHRFAPISTVQVPVSHRTAPRSSRTHEAQQGSIMCQGGVRMQFRSWRRSARPQCGRWAGQTSSTATRSA